eukprot:GHVU01213631.1.p1 GENE.GHVU01213631.1~~GHVU01213631.1.p1  ORF type:complete len:125 (+),score=21.36 GHVU01213631.1:57-377(+)
MSYNQSSEPSKTSGQYHSTKGNVVQMVGDATGLESWQTSGKEEHAQGEAEYKASQAKGYAEGISDRVAGYKDSVVGAVTDDKSQQVSGNAQKEQGRAQQKANEPSS